MMNALFLVTYICSALTCSETHARFNDYVQRTYSLETCNLNAHWNAVSGLRENAAIGITEERSWCQVESEGPDYTITTHADGTRSVAYLTYRALDCSPADRRRWPDKCD